VSNQKDPRSLPPTSFTPTRYRVVEKWRTHVSCDVYYSHVQSFLAFFSWERPPWTIRSSVGPLDAVVAPNTFAVTMGRPKASEKRTLKRRLVVLFAVQSCGGWDIDAFRPCHPPAPPRTKGMTHTLPLLGSSRLYADWDDGNSQDSNNWRSMDDEEKDFARREGAEQEETDWQTLLEQKKDGSFWSSFEPSVEGSEDTTTNSTSTQQTTTATIPSTEEQDAEVWLNTLASLSAEEVEFNLKEADRADKARQMEEWGFDSDTIFNTLGVAIKEEDTEEPVGMQVYREQAFLDEVDLQTVESHKMVELDEDGEPTRSQMVYVDEHTCIGCTNCAMIAQSTFFMHQEHGRARVFNQWGDDDETIQVAIETCPVDCIHYVPFTELVELEKDRRNQNINFKARLVSQAENGNSLSHLSGGGPNAFTAPQTISGNMGSRCSNCPTRGCADCPMYGVGDNPVFKQKEEARKARLAKRKLQQQREADEKSVEL